MKIDTMFVKNIDTRSTKLGYKHNPTGWEMYTDGGPRVLVFSTTNREGGKMQKIS